MSVTVIASPPGQPDPCSPAPGPLAVAQAVARCRPTVLRCAPGGPEPPVLQALQGMSRGEGVLASALLTACSDHNVIDAAIEACSRGARTYTSTDGPGLLRMADALFRAARLELPIVMTVSARADEDPQGGWQDHSHAMALRDCGWVQLYPSGDQDAVDVHVQAFRIAESLSLPVMVCMDEFRGSESDEPLEVPSQAAVEVFLDHSEPSSPIDLSRVTLAAEDPSTNMERRYLAHIRRSAALKTIRHVASDFRVRFGRDSSGLLLSRHGRSARIVVLGVGSVFEAIASIVEELRPAGLNTGTIAVKSFRPFPARELAGILAHSQRVVVVERAVAPWTGGVISADVRAALVGLPVETHTAIAGLGGREISADSVRLLLRRAARGLLGDVCFLDLRRELVPHGPDSVPRRRTRARDTVQRAPEMSWQRGSATLL